MDYEKIKKYYLDTVDNIHEEALFASSLDFFKNGFTLTDDDRLNFFSLELSPWIKFLCQWFDDPATEWIYLLQGSQTTKTTFMMGIFLYASKFIKGAIPITWIWNVEEEGNMFVSERLKPFLDSQGFESSKNWRRQAFRVFNASLKVGYASTKNSMRSKPARFVFGDECSLWRETVSYLKRRTRTFINKRKGVFGTTPSDSPKHHSWKEFTIGNVYCFFVKCPKCGKAQRLKFGSLIWEKGSIGEGEKGEKGEKEGEKDGGIIRDNDIIRKTTRYKCEFCGDLWTEKQKLEILQTGEPICVDPDTWERGKEKDSTSKTLQLSALYSPFTPWYQVVIDFLDAKAAGWEVLKVFITDELAELPKAPGDKLEKRKIERYRDSSRISGFLEGYDAYSAGVDVQGSGLVYYVLMGFRKGVTISGHILTYGKVNWKSSKGNEDVIDWGPLFNVLSPYKERLYKCPVDATDGKEQQNIIDFCTWAGPPFIPLLDNGSEQIAKIKYTSLNPNLGWANKLLKMFSINSAMFKNEIAAAFDRQPGTPGAWTLPSDVSNEFLTHLSNEQRTTRKRGGAYVLAWEPKYSGAPQHYFSAMVYAFSAIEEIRHLLQERVETGTERGQGKRSFRRINL